jgi:hypothetical protein
MKSFFKTALLIFLITVALCECVSRYFIKRDFGTPFWHPSKIIYTFYPELLSLPAQLDSGSINLLILGGSAITDTLCHTSENIKRELANSGKPINVFNLAQFAHTTFDSRVKFSYCKKMNFDYVFVYDGINDTRANNCPAAVFCDNYSHIHFYSQVNIFERHPEINFFTLPFLLDYYWNEWKIKTGRKKTIPKEYFVMNEKMMDLTAIIQADTPGTEGYNARQIIKQHQDKVMGSNLVRVDSLWWEEGAKVKSAKSFRNNLTNIYQSKKPKTKLILTSYAWYQPEDYTLHRFLYEKMDYAEQRWPTEQYGKPEHVANGIKTHNKIIDSIASQHPEIIYFSFNDSVLHSGIYFNDICHLADSGQLLLGRILANRIRKR